MKFVGINIEQNIRYWLVLKMAERNHIIQIIINALGSNLGESKSAFKRKKKKNQKNVLFSHI